MNWAKFDETPENFATPPSFRQSETFVPRSYPAAFNNTASTATSFSQPAFTSTPKQSFQQSFGGDSELFSTAHNFSDLSLSASAATSAATTSAATLANATTCHLAPSLRRVASAADIPAPFRPLNFVQKAVVQGKLNSPTSAATLQVLDFFNHNKNSYSSPYLPEFFRSHLSISSLPDARMLRALYDSPRRAEVQDLISFSVKDVTDKNIQTDSFLDRTLDNNNKTGTLGAGLSSKQLRNLKSRHGIDLANIHEGPRPKRNAKKF